MIKNLEFLHGLPPGEYQLSVNVLEGKDLLGQYRRIYLYAEDTSDDRNVHLVGYDELKQTQGGHGWVREDRT